VTAQVNTELLEELRKFGAFDVTACFNCGNCTAVCPLSNGDASFPRRIIRYGQIGDRERLLSSKEPWLCYYCGECSQTCPRGANPGEIMMAARRYLTAQYDWTGLSRLMYRSGLWEIAILTLVAVGVVLLFTLPDSFGFGLLSQSAPEALSTVRLDRFAPKEIVHWGDLVLAAVLTFFLLTNAARMFFRVTQGERLPLRLYITELPQLILHGLTQMRWKGCEDREAIKNWLRHLLLVTGYTSMFVLVVIFLPWFQVEDNSIHWTSYLGYYATAVLLGATAWMLVDRIRKRGEMFRFSHLSDWLFPILLFLTAITGILVHVLRMLDLAMPTYVMYMVHLAIAVPMLAVEVPFGKWAHLIYRPLAIYVAAVAGKVDEFSARDMITASSVSASK